MAGQFCYVLTTHFEISKQLCIHLRIEVHFFVIRSSSDGMYYGMVMSVRPSVCPSVRPSVRVSVRPFSALFSYMLWHIELKFCTWLCFNVLQIKFECRQFASSFFGVMPLLELRILEIQFSALFSYMLWHIELKFCIWLCFTVLQIKFECRQFLWELCPFWNSKYSCWAHA